MASLRFSAPVLRAALLPVRTTAVYSRYLVQRLIHNSGQSRSYSSAGHADRGRMGGDLPWLIGSIVVTVPSAYYLLSLSPKKENPHHHDSAAADSSTAEEESASSDEGTATSQDNANSESASEATENSQDQASSVKSAGETAEGEGDEPEQSAQSGDAGNPNQDGEEVTLSIPRSATADRFRARLQRLSLTLMQNVGKSPSQTDPPAGTKETTSANETSGKQEGPSNPDPVPHDEKGEATSK